MPDFTLAAAEFKRQAVILDALVEAVEVVARQDGITRYNIAGTELPTLPPGGQNTMAAAAVVLLASHFEEYIRQQIEEYARGFVVEFPNFSVDVKDRLADIYWRLGSKRLSRIQPKYDPRWASVADPLLRGLLDYPIGGQISALVTRFICDHENNMRWDVIVELSGRIGIKKLPERLHKSSDLRIHLGGPSRHEFSSVLKQKLNAFYELRNGIVHSIAQNAGIGRSTFDGWSEFFRLFAGAFASGVELSYTEFKKDIEKKVSTSALAAAG